LQERVASTRVSFSRPVSMAYTILSLHHAHSLAQGLEGAHSEPQGGEGVGDDTPNESRSSYEEEEEGEITSPPLSSSCETPPSFSDIVGRQVGATVGERHQK
jgi:hypothetical protein